MAKPAPEISKGDKPVRAATARGLARLGAVQALYQMDLAGTPLDAALAEYETFRLGQTIDEDEYRPADTGYFRHLVSGVVKDQPMLDKAIDDTLAKGWPLKRIETLLRSILRAGAFELHRRTDIPAAVIISEYVEIARAFYETEETSLVNAVLDALARRKATS